MLPLLGNRYIYFIIFTLQSNIVIQINFNLFLRFTASHGISLNYFIFRIHRQHNNHLFYYYYTDPQDHESVILKNFTILLGKQFTHYAKGTLSSFVRTPTAYRITNSFLFQCLHLQNSLSNFPLQYFFTIAKFTILSLRGWFPFIPTSFHSSYLIWYILS